MVKSLVALTTLAPSLAIAAAVSPVLPVTWSCATLVARTCSHSLAWSGSVSDFDHAALSALAPRIASHSLVATTPRKLPSRTTLTMPGIALSAASSTLCKVAPIAGGRPTRPCRADHLVIRRRLLLDRLLGIERERKSFAADQFGVAHLLAAAGDHAIGDGEIAGAELLGGFREQGLKRGRRGLTQLHAADRDREAAPGRTLFGCERRIAFDQLDARDRHIEFVRHDLAQRRGDAGAEVDLAGIDRDFAGLVDGEERIDFGKGEGLRRPLRQRVGERTCERKAEDDRAGAPSMGTVQAPRCPSPQPKRGPCSPRSPRNA